MRWLLPLLLLAGCGGGSGGSEPPVADRHDVLYCYYGDSDTIVAEVKDHTNCLTIFALWYGTATAVQHAMQAKAAGINSLILAIGHDPASIRQLFTAFQAANVLGNVVALYPQDEPDVNGYSDDQMIALAEIVRGVAREYPELTNVKLAVIYGPGGATPGISAFDWVGRDNFGRGPQEVGLTGGQRLILISGGTFFEAPDIFVDYAERTPEVVLYLGFAWISYMDATGIHVGIRDNGMAPAYRAVGVKLTH